MNLALRRLPWQGARTVLVLLLACAAAAGIYATFSQLDAGGEVARDAASRDGADGIDLSLIAATQQRIEREARPAQTPAAPAVRPRAAAAAATRGTQARAGGGRVAAGFQSGSGSRTSTGGGGSGTQLPGPGALPGGTGGGGGGSSSTPGTGAVAPVVDGALDTVGATAGGALG